MSDDRPPDTDATDADGYDRDHAGDDVQAARNRERTTDAVDRTDRETTAAARGGAQSEEPAPEQRRGTDADAATTTGPGGDGDGDDGGTDGSGGRSSRIAFWISALFGLALAVGSVALVSGRAPFFEDVLRVRPTVEGGGVGADWLVGNTGPILEAAITVVHFADVVMGIFILLMVFIHWAAFRRLGARMRPPAGSTRARGSAAATDGGERTDGSRYSSDRRSDVGEPSVARRTSDSPAEGDRGSSAADSDSSNGPADDSVRDDGGDRP